MYGPKQPAGVRSWQITERSCRGVNHDYSNKWSPTMSLLVGGLGYGSSMPDGSSAGPSIFWLWEVDLNAKSLRGERGVNFSVHGRVSEVSTLSGRNPWEVFESDPPYLLGWVRELQVSNSGRSLEFQSLDLDFTLPMTPRGVKSPSNWCLVSIQIILRR